MNKINILEILKNVPIGTKLYSPLCGEVTLHEIDEKAEYPISVSDNGGHILFTEDGKYFTDCPEAECLLFPSKENRDWNTFKVNKQSLPVDTPCMVSNYLDNFQLRYYAHDN